MAFAKSSLPVATNQFGIFRPIFDFARETPFGLTTLGCAMLGPGVTAPAWSTYGFVIADPTSPGIPVAKPANCITAGAWNLTCEMADLVEFIPYAVGFDDDAAPTAYAAPAEGESYEFSVWAYKWVHRIQQRVDGGSRFARPAVCVPAARISCVTGALAFEGVDPEICSGAAGALPKLMKDVTVEEDYTLSPGVRVFGGDPGTPTTGVMGCVFDLRGVDGLLIYPHVMPANRGLSLFHSFL